MSEATAANISEATAVLSRSSRRAFLKMAAATAAGLTIGFHWSGPLSRALADTSKDFAPNAFLRIAPDNSVTVIAKHLEMGQGTYTGLATIVAEELDADWAQIRVESAPADASKYAAWFVIRRAIARRRSATWPPRRRASRCRTRQR
jgi:CO/xanthine dehydrogenase Mo-binding subunit